MTVTLLNCRYTIVSTGGTASALESAGVAVTKVEKLTKFPEMVCKSLALGYAQSLCIGVSFDILLSLCRYTMVFISRTTIQQYVLQF